MIKELMFKWFGLEFPIPCATCEVLKDSLSIERQLNKVLLDKLLDRSQPEPAKIEPVDPKLMKPRHVPWAVKRQMLEAEDRAASVRLRQVTQEIQQTERKDDEQVTNLEKKMGL